MSTPRKPTRSATPAWASIAVVLALSAVFGLLVLPRLRPAESKLIGIPAPLFTLPVIDVEGSGNRINLKDLKGKVVVLDFWASWCGPCREQMAIVDQVASRYDDRGAIVVGVNTGDERSAAINYLRSRALSYASVFDESSSVGRAYGVESLPTLVIIDRTGKIAALRQGVVRERELTQLIDQALAG